MQSPCPGTMIPDLYTRMPADTAPSPTDPPIEPTPTDPTVPDVTSPEPGPTSPSLLIDGGTPRDAVLLSLIPADLA